MLTDKERKEINGKMLQIKRYIESSDFQLAYPLLDELKQIDDPDVQVLVNTLEEIVKREQADVFFQPRTALITIVAGAVIGGIIGVIQGHWLLFIIIGAVVGFFIDIWRWQKRIRAS